MTSPKRKNGQRNTTEKKINPNNIIVVLLVLMRNKHDLKHTTRTDPHVWSENVGVSAEQFQYFITQVYNIHKYNTL
jgi:hypothetical protein